MKLIDQLLKHTEEKSFFFFQIFPTRQNYSPNFLKNVLNEWFFVLIQDILITINNNWTIIWPISMLNQVLSIRWFALLVNKKSQVTTLSNNFEEKIMEWNNGNLVILLAGLNKIVEEEEEDGEKLKVKLNDCHHFVTITEMENERNKVFNFKMSKLETKVINSHREFSFKLLRLVIFFTPIKTICCLKNSICCILK